MELPIALLSACSNAKNYACASTQNLILFFVSYHKSENENLQYNFHFDRLLSFPCPPAIGIITPDSLNAVSNFVTQNSYQIISS
jgi:hypothetical protein